MEVILNIFRRSRIFQGAERKQQVPQQLFGAVIFQTHPTRFAQQPLGFLGKEQCLLRVRILQGCSVKQNSSVAISLLSWSRGSRVIPGSYMFAPSEGHSQGLSVISRILMLFITHPSGSACVRERTALYLWISLPAGAGISSRNSKWRKKCVSA